MPTKEDYEKLINNCMIEGFQVEEKILNINIKINQLLIELENLEKRVVLIESERFKFNFDEEKYERKFREKSYSYYFIFDSILKFESIPYDEIENYLPDHEEEYLIFRNYKLHSVRESKRKLRTEKLDLEKTKQSLLEDFHEIEERRIALKEELERNFI